MKSNPLLRNLLAATTLAAGTSVNAAVIAEYTFPLVGGVVSQPTTATATTVASGVSASIFGGGGVTAVSFSAGLADTGSTSDLGNAFLNRVNTPTTPNVDAAGTTGYYFSFTVTPDFGNSLNLQSLSFFYGDAQTDASPTALNLGLYTSVDSYAAQVGTSLSWAPATTTKAAPADYFTTASGAQYATLDLSGPAFQNLTTATTFRIYGWDNIATAGQIRIDDVTLNGTVVPEPSAAILGGLGLLAILRRRR
jgi:hypothetical protein